MKVDIHNKIELWLESLGYSFNDELYSQVAKMSYYRPSYKIMADAVLKTIKISNPILNSDEAWKYTTNFVNGMKSNLIMNNTYFQSVLKNGLFQTINNKQDRETSLFETYDVEKNNYNFLKNVWISNEDQKRKFDFVIIINGFPLIIVEIVSKSDSDSFEQSFLKLEEDFDKFPMFFNFNKMIIITDGITFKLGSLYDFQEEYIIFNGLIKEYSENDSFTIIQLEKILSSNNILNFLKENKDSIDIRNYIKKNLNEEIRGKDIITDKKDLDQGNMTNKKDSDKGIDNLEDIEADEELSFLANLFNPSLDEVLESKQFKEKIEKAREVPDFKENKMYIKDFQENKNIETLETFIKANEKLVIKEINRFIGYQTTSLDFDDMYQLGYIGLLKAIKNFDLDMENEFSTYAVYWIWQSIGRGIKNDSLLVRIPVHRWVDLFKLNKLEKSSEIKFKIVDYDWISRELGLSKEKTMELTMIRNTFMNITSLDIPIGADEDTSLGELIADEEYSVEEIILNKELRQKLEEILDTLDDRSKDVLVRRFGLNYEKPMTLEEIGEIHNVTRERIRQIESKALKKLRHPSRSKKIKSFLE